MDTGRRSTAHRRVAACRQLLRTESGSRSGDGGVQARVQQLCALSDSSLGPLAGSGFVYEGGGGLAQGLGI